MSAILSPASAQRLADRLRRNTLFASAVALNRSANLVQGIMRQSMRRNFTIRRGDFIDRLIKIRNSDRATKDNLTTRIRVEGPTNDLNDRAANLLLQHELGGTQVRSNVLDIKAMERSARQGMYFIQGKALQNGSVPPRALFPENLGLAPKRDADGSSYYALGRGSIKKKLTPFRKTSGHKVRIEGKSNTFMVNPLYQQTKLKMPVIFQRVGKGLRVLWIFKGQRTLRPRLAFTDTVTKGFDRVLRAQFAEAFRDAMRPR
jgi:hypothetical protein